MKDDGHDDMMETQQQHTLISNTRIKLLTHELTAYTRVSEKIVQITITKEVFGLWEQIIQLWKAENVSFWDQSLHLVRSQKDV